MIAHVLHIGDTHARPGERRADWLRALDAAIAYGGSLDHLAAWIWAGDLFHSVSEAADRNALEARAQRMAELAPVIIVKGNHDAAGELEVYTRLASPWGIFVSEVPELLRIPTPLVEDPAPADEGVLTRTVDLAVYTLPYPNRGALVAAGTMPDAISQQARAVLDSLLVAAAADLARIPRAIKLFAGHANVTGARASTGQPQVGVDVELDPAMLARLPADVHVAMSHIHKHQTVGRAVYAGSICRMDFGELDPKGIIDIAYDVQPEAITLAGWTFVPLDVPPMYQIDGELTAAGFEFRVVDASASGDMVDLGGAGLELDADGWRPTTWKGADVRVRYTYRRAEASLLNVAHIHAEFAEARSLKIEAIPAAEAEIRAPEVVAATTLVDKLTHYATRHGLVWSPALAEKAADLETRAADDWRQAALARIGAIGADILPE